MVITVNNWYAGATVTANSGLSNNATTRYEVIDSSTGSFTITSPTLTAGVSNNHSRADLKINMTAAVSNLEVNFTGGIVDSGHNYYLMGQHVTAALSPGGLPPSSYNWAATGGEPFKNYTASLNSAHPVPLGSETGSLFGFYVKHPTTGGPDVSVVCSAHLSVPAGTVPAGGLDVWVVGYLKVARPEVASFSAYTPQNAASYPGPENIILPGYPANGVGLYVPPDPTQMAFRGVSAAGAGSPNGDNLGIRWDGYIQTSTLGASLNPWGGDGGWNYVQLVVAGRHRMNKGVYQANLANGPTILDTTYPYEPAPYSPDPYSPGTYPANGRRNTAGDAPSVGLAPGLTEVDAMDSFGTWMMYRPPGTDSVLVPIKKITWTWSGTAQLTGGTWIMNSSDSGWQYAGDYPAFPEWDAYATSTMVNTWNPPVP